MAYKFTVEIELEDGRFCDGCPCLKRNAHNSYFDQCSLNFGIRTNQSGEKIRPQACLDRYGPGEKEK